MRTWKRLGIGLLTTTMLIGGGMASAQKEQPKEQSKEQPKESDPFQNLGLSADQRSKLETAKKEQMSAQNGRQQKLMELRKKLTSLVTDKKASDKEIDQVANQLEITTREAMKTEMKFFKTLRQILTQEQLTTLAKGGSK
jgi:Spy/CpxP family protein refolding chaperone